MAVSDFTANMKAYKERGPADLKLSAETRDEYLKLIAQLRMSLRSRMQILDSQGWDRLGGTGEIPSAHQTKRNLEIDAIRFRRTLSDYLDFLDEFEGVVKASSDRLLKSG